MSDIEEKLKDISPRYAYWAKLPRWTIEEAAFLFVDVDPRKAEKLNERLSGGKLWRINSYAEKYTEILGILRCDASVPNSEIHKKNAPLTYIKWAEERDFDIPPALLAALKKYEHLHKNKEKDSIKKVASQSHEAETADMIKSQKRVSTYSFILSVLLSKQYPKAFGKEAEITDKNKGHYEIAGFILEEAGKHFDELIDKDVIASAVADAKKYYKTKAKQKPK